MLGWLGIGDKDKEKAKAEAEAQASSEKVHNEILILEKWNFEFFFWRRLKNKTNQKLVVL